MVNKIGFKRDSKTSEFTKSENSKLRRDMIASVMKEAGHTKGDILKLRGGQIEIAFMLMDGTTIT